MGTRLNSRILIGRLEEAVLFSFVRLGVRLGDSYLPAIAISRDLGGLEPGPLYATLERLENKELISVRCASPNGKPGGRRMRLFTITEQGWKMLIRINEYNDLIRRGANLGATTSAR